MTVTSIGARRFDAAAKSSDTNPSDCIMACLERWSRDGAPQSIIILEVHVDPEDEGTTIGIINAGPATTNERLGVMARASALQIERAHG